MRVSDGSAFGEWHDSMHLQTRMCMCAIKPADGIPRWQSYAEADCNLLQVL